MRRECPSYSTCLEVTPVNDIVITGGSVLTTDGIESVDVGITDGKVAKIGRDLDVSTVP